MVCRKCGSDVPSDADTCPSCGAELERAPQAFEEESERLRTMTQQLKAVGGGEEEQTFGPGEEVADRFEIREFVDSGPFGDVYRARDSVIEADVALKIFDEEVVRDPVEEEAFLEGTRAARSMTQENVVRVHGSGVYEGHPWVSMQYLEGLTLEKTLEMREEKGERFEIEEVEPIVNEITLALQHIAREYPHGDLKPSNIFLLPEVLKVTDGYVMEAVPGDVFGDRLSDNRHLAPELFTSIDEADARCDVYSMGVLIGEMVFGRDYQAGSSVVEEDGSERSAVDALCRRATAFDPAERYPTVQALSEDFSTLVDTGRLLEGGAGPAEPAEPVEAAEPSGGPESAPIELDEQVPEDEIATREYDRDEDVPDESELPEPTPEVGGAASPTAPTEEYDRDGEGPEVPAGGPSPSPGGGAPPETADDGGEDEPSKPVGVMAVAGLMLAAAVALVWVQSDSSEPVRIEDDPEPKAKAAGASPDAGRRDTGPDPEVVTAAVDSARGVLSGALSPAGEQATQRAEKLAEKREKQKAEEQQESQGSGSGSAARQRGGRPPDEPPPAEGTDCPSGMVLIERDDGNYCIDRYEYPGKGKRPTTNVTWFEAKKKCRKQSKRLCKHDEWGRACGGKYPYGADWDPSACNTQDRDGFARTLKPSGDFEACESWPGTYDMVGNAFEWVAEQKIVGGGFGSGPEVANCNYSSPKEPGSSAPNIGFRCCARPE